MRADFFGQQKGDVITPARETLKGPALLVNICVEIKFYGAFIDATNRTSSGAVSPRF